MRLNEKSLTDAINTKQAGSANAKEYSGHRLRLEQRFLMKEVARLPDREILELLPTAVVLWSRLDTAAH